MTLQRHVAEMRFAAITTKPVAVERRKSRRVFRPDGTEIKRKRPARPQRNHRPRTFTLWELLSKCVRKGTE